MTDRLYYNDSYLIAFEAEVEEAADDGRRLYLNRSAFYPTSGGQLHDLGTINGVTILDVIDEEDRLAHILAGPLPVGPIRGSINWKRRFDHMQQHTGQHLLSAVFESLLGVRTASVHFGDVSATVDLEIPALSSQLIEAVERRANELVAENRTVTISYEDAGQAQGLRKASAREGMLRLISISDLDKSACGGTHVRNTGEIGPIVLRKLDKVRGNVRVEFLCGMRAVDQIRKEYDALSTISRHFSCPPEDIAPAVAALLERAKDVDKTVKLLSSKVAQNEGRDLYTATEPNAEGMRLVRRTMDTAINDDTRMLAQNFVAQGKAAILLISANPPAVLLACSNDSNLHAGNLLKAALTAAGGKGGGNNALAQGSLPSKEAAAVVETELAKYGL